MVIDDTMGAQEPGVAGVRDAAVLTVSVVAAAFFGNHHAQTRAVWRATGYL